ncbi:MAG: hypothetical protein AB8B93_02010 [Pseudomonadales bacterium]
MPETIRPRRPQGWNALLVKGHAHTSSRSKERAVQRQTMEDEAAEYLNERLAKDQGSVQGARDGAERICDHHTLAARQGHLQYCHSVPMVPLAHVQHHAVSRPHGLLQSLAQRTA